MLEYATLMFGCGGATMSGRNVCQREEKAGLTRRQFLKLTGSALGAAAVLPFADLASVYADEPVPTFAPPASLGRVAAWGVEIRQKPSLDAKLVRTAQRDEVLKLRGQCLGKPLMPHNAIWYQTDDGYVYSSWIQPVEDIKNIPDPEKTVEKFWGEITVPFSDSRWSPGLKSARYMRLYYTAVFQVVEAVIGKDGQWWYRLQGGITWSPGPYVPAVHIRRVDPSELTPISPEVIDKRIEVSLKEQTVTAYENDQPVLTARVASGFGVHYTPKGDHTVLWKSPTSRMTGGAGADYYDLPGVPFPTFITPSGVAIHGTYWHNDFGRPRSHGCLNVPSPIARWFWRWTLPSAPYDAAIYRMPPDAKGTLVKVS
jgi:lipoprotein-anchoring transpeptidase ErfK/SrfK